MQKVEHDSQYQYWIIDGLYGSLTIYIFLFLWACNLLQSQFELLVLSVRNGMPNTLSSYVLAFIDSE